MEKVKITIEYKDITRSTDFYAAKTINVLEFIIRDFPEELRDEIREICGLS